MRFRTWRIVAIAGSILLVIIVGALVLNYRTQEIAASNYEVEASKAWSEAQSVNSDFSNQILSLKPQNSSQGTVCHEAKVQLQRLNALSLPTDAPDEYTEFNSTFPDAVTANKRYYRNVLELCSGTQDASETVLSELYALAQNTEDRYEQSYRLMPTVGIRMEQGTLTGINNRLSKIFHVPPKPAVVEKPRREVVVVPKPYIVERPVPVPYTSSGFSPNNPPVRGMNIVVDTPAKGGLNLRLEPSRYAERMSGKEVISNGERLRVISRDGDWIEVETIDGYYGYVRWFKDGVTYVSPA